MEYFVHEKGICESTSVGKDTKIWAFAHVLPKAIIGSNCNICDNVFIENDVVIGNNVTIKCGVQVWDGIKIEDNVFIGPNATFTNDPMPRSKQYPDSFSKTHIAEGASIGANATVLPGIRIGRSAMVGAGAIVTSDVPDFAIITGNPARVVNFVDANIIETNNNSSIKGVSRIDFIHKADSRGSLVFGEIENHLPFAPKRFFYLCDIPNNKHRADHAHRECTQVFLSIRGKNKIFLRDLHHKEIHILNEGEGLIVPPKVWVNYYDTNPNDILMVFNSHKFDEKDYIRCADEFYNMAGRS